MVPSAVGLVFRAVIAEITKGNLKLSNVEKERVDEVIGERIKEIAAMGRLAYEEKNGPVPPWEKIKEVGLFPDK